MSLLLRATMATGSRAFLYSSHGRAGIFACPAASVRPDHIALPLRPRTSISMSVAGVPVSRFDTNMSDVPSWFNLRIIPRLVTSINRRSLKLAAFSDVPTWIINTPVLSLATRSI